MSGSGTVLLVRHARSSANVAGILAGRSAGVHLDELGQRQATELAARLAGLPVTRLVCSPLERCRETVAPLAAELGLTVAIDDRLTEVDYGDWTGRSLSELAGEDLWRVVQQQPTAAVFPGGEALAAVSTRASAAVRELAAGPGLVVICSHGDVVKAVLADALGLHLDGFQRLHVAPASVSVVRYTPMRPMVERINYTGDLSALLPPPAPESGVDGAAAGTGSDAADGSSDAADGSADAVVGGAAR